MMIGDILYITDDILFFCMALCGIYLFIFALSALFRRSDKYQKAEEDYRFVIFTPPGAVIDNQEYPENLYTIIIYEDLFQTLKQLQEAHFDIAVILGETTHISTHLLQNLNNAYDSGVMAMQLHHIIAPRPTGKLHRAAIYEEIRNSLFRLGPAQAGLPSMFDKYDIAVDFQWLKRNMKRAESNLESMLLRQYIYIEYLNDAIVYSKAPRQQPRRMALGKVFSKFPSTLLAGNWGYGAKLFRQILPSWQTLLVIITVWCLFITCYEWRFCLKWWILLFGLLITICMAIPDYLVEKNTRKSKLSKYL